MSDDGERMIIDFGECTGIRDRDKVQGYLDQANWDLVRAIKLVTSQESQKLPSELTSPDVVMEDVPNNVTGSSNRISVSNDYFSGPSTSKSRIEFNVYSHDLDKTCTFHLYDNDTVGHVKTCIEKEWGFPKCQQLITGWTTEPKNDDIKLKHLKLDQKVALTVCSDIVIDNSLNRVSNRSESSTNSHSLHIYDEVHSKDYTIPYNSSTKILDIKTKMSEKSNIPIEKQLWSGWPLSCKSDDLILMQLGLNTPVHEVSFRSDLSSSNRKKRTNSKVSLPDSDSDSYSSNDDEDMHSIIDDELFEDEISSRNCVYSLVPEDFENETTACIQFAVSFQEKYGVIHPDFFPGTLEEAFNEACQKPAKEKKLLAVYLHHNNSILTNVFCSELLCVESVLHYLGEHYIVWGWDVTLDTNKAFLCHNMQTLIGREASFAVKSTRVEEYPVILIINRARRNTEILSVIHGDVNSNELLSQLIHAVDIFTEQQIIESKEEDDRMAREMIKVEQDQAYQQSLLVDRAKLEAKRKQEQLEMEEQAKIEDARQKEAVKKEANRRALESTLPNEPAENTEGITKIRIRIHQDQFLERRFLKNEPVKLLLEFLVVRGFDTADYKVITSFPRRDLTTLDASSTFEDLKLYPQETVRLEER